MLKISLRKSKVTQGEVEGDVFDLNMYYYLCAYVYILPSVIHVFSATTRGRLCLRATPSYSAHHWLTADHMGLSLTHIRSSGWGQRGRGGKKRSVRKDLQSWESRGGLTLQGDCGGERDREMTEWEIQQPSWWRMFTPELDTHSRHICKRPLSFLELCGGSFFSWKRQMGIVNGLSW